MYHFFEANGRWPSRPVSARQAGIEELRQQHFDLATEHARMMGVGRGWAQRVRLLGRVVVVGKAFSLGGAFFVEWTDK